MADRNGSTPLRAAVAQIQSDWDVEGNTRADLVRYLVEVRPESLEEADHRGFLPLHVAADSVVPALGVVRLLVAA
jgi:hypothetical protein